MFQPWRAYVGGPHRAVASVTPPRGCTEDMGRAEDATLYEAVEDGDVEAARAALDAGADLNMRDLVRPGHVLRRR